MAAIEYWIQFENRAGDLAPRRRNRMKGETFSGAAKTTTSPETGTTRTGNCPMARGPARRSTTAKITATTTMATTTTSTRTVPVTAMLEAGPADPGGRLWRFATSI